MEVGAFNNNLLLSVIFVTFDSGEKSEKKLKFNLLFIAMIKNDKKLIKIANLKHGFQLLFYVVDFEWQNYYDQMNYQQHNPCLHHLFE